MLDNNLHGASDVAALHIGSPNQFRRPIRAHEVHLHLAITENVNMGRLMIVDENYEAQAVHTKDRDPSDKITHWDGFFNDA